LKVLGSLLVQHSCLQFQLRRELELMRADELSEKILDALDTHEEKAKEIR
jgi:hypothetical protein